ncbi:MAG: hypothetical protein AAFP04_13255 [Myxococcota bacterium]
MFREEVSHDSPALVMQRRTALCRAMGDDDNDNRRGRLVDLLLSEIAELAGQRQGPVEVVIVDAQDEVVINAQGWPLLERQASEPPEPQALNLALSILARWAREEFDGLLDVMIDMPLEHRAALVENILSRVQAGDSDYRRNVASLLRFIDQGLALDGESVTLSVRIQDALIGELADA